MKNVLGMVTGYGLLTVEKNEHRQMRKMMNPAFSLPNLSSRALSSLPHFGSYKNPCTEMDQYHMAIDSLLRIFTGHVISTRDPDKGVVLPIYEWSEFDVFGLLHRTDLMVIYSVKSDARHHLQYSFFLRCKLSP